MSRRYYIGVYRDPGDFSFYWADSYPDVSAITALGLGVSSIWDSAMRWYLTVQ